MNCKHALIKKLTFFEVIVPLVITGFIGQGMHLVNFVVSANSRWILFLILALYFLCNARLLLKLPNTLLWVLWVYLLWCASTMVWSEAFILSCVKSISLIFIITVMISTGYAWVQRKQWQHSLSWLFLLTILVFLSGILGRGAIATASYADQPVLYTGLTGSPNLFGVFQAMILPYLLWQAYSNWRRKHKKFLLSAIAVIFNLIFLILSSSRSAILMAISVVLFFFLSMNLKNKYIVLSTMAVLALGIGTLTSISLNALIYKSYNGDVFNSRRYVWMTSYQQALLGGWIGGGYGVSIGNGEFSMVNLNAANYGREKSSSQLGIIEETGIIGLCLYLLVLVVYFAIVCRFWITLKSSSNFKVMLGLIIGAMFGIILVSVFEAWWDAPASNESIYFWTLFGTSFGLIHAIKRTPSGDIHHISHA